MKFIGIFFAAFLLVACSDTRKESYTKIDIEFTNFINVQNIHELDNLIYETRLIIKILNLRIRPNWEANDPRWLWHINRDNIMREQYKKRLNELEYRRKEIQNNTFINTPHNTTRFPEDLPLGAEIPAAKIKFGIMEIQGLSYEEEFQDFIMEAFNEIRMLLNIASE